MSYRDREQGGMRLPRLDDIVAAPDHDPMLAALLAARADEQTFILAGRPGTGRSRRALALTAALRRRGIPVAWLSRPDQDPLGAMAKLARSMGLPAHLGRPLYMRQLQRRVFDELRRGAPQGVLVMDDVEDCPSALHPFSELGWATLLVTDTGLEAAHPSGARWLDLGASPPVPPERPTDAIDIAGNRATIAQVEAALCVLPDTWISPRLIESVLDLELPVVRICLQAIQQAGRSDVRFHDLRTRLHPARRAEARANLQTDEKRWTSLHAQVAAGLHRFAITLHAGNATHSDLALARELCTHLDLATWSAPGTDLGPVLSASLGLYDLVGAGPRFEHTLHALAEDDHADLSANLTARLALWRARGAMARRDLSAGPWLRRAVKGCQVAQDAAGLLDALLTLATLSLSERDTEQAQKYLWQAGAAATNANKAQQALLQRLNAQLSLAGGRTEEARLTLQRTHEGLSKSELDPRAKRVCADIALDLAALNMRRGDDSTQLHAVQLATEALVLHEQNGDLVGQGYALLRRADCYRRTADTRLQRRDVEDAVRCLRDADDAQAECDALLARSQCLLEQYTQTNEPDYALSAYSDATEARLALMGLGVRGQGTDSALVVEQLQAYSAHALALLRPADDRTERHRLLHEAQLGLQRASDGFRRRGEGHAAAQCLERLAEVVSAQGEPRGQVEAAAYLQDAARLYHDAGFEAEEAQCHAELAAVLHGIDNRRDQARALAMALFEPARKRGDLRTLQRVAPMLFNTWTVGAGRYKPLVPRELAVEGVVPALDTETGAPVSLIVHPSTSDGKAALELELASLALLADQPGFARVLDDGTWADGYGSLAFLVTEPLPVLTFSAFVDAASPSVSLEDTVRALALALDALALAHMAGVTLGGLSDDRLLVRDDGTPVLRGARTAVTLDPAERGAVTPVPPALQDLADICDLAVNAIFRDQAPPRAQDNSTRARLYRCLVAVSVADPNEPAWTALTLREAILNAASPERATHGPMAWLSRPIASLFADVRAPDEQEATTALRRLFEGTDRILWELTDAARCLWSRVGGTAARIRDELEIWERHGLIRRSGQSLLIETVAFESWMTRVRPLLAPERRPATLRPNQLDELLSFINLLYPYATLDMLHAAQDLRGETLTQALTELEQRGEIRRHGAHYLGAAPACSTAGALGLAQRKRVATALGENPVLRLRQLAACDDREETIPCALTVAAEARAQERPAESLEAIEIGLRALRRKRLRDHQTRALLEEWLLLAAADARPASWRALWLTLQRALPHSPSSSALLNLASAGCLVIADRPPLRLRKPTPDPVAEGMRLLEEVPPQTRHELELLRRVLRLYALRKSPGAEASTRASKELEELRDWMEALPVGAGPDRDWLFRRLHRYEARELDSNDDFWGAADHHLLATERCPLSISTCSSFLSAAASLCEDGRDDQEAQRLVSMGANVAAGLRHRRYGLQAAWLSRRLAARAHGVTAQPDLELVSIAQQVGSPEDERQILLQEAAIALRHVIPVPPMEAPPGFAALPQHVANARVLATLAASRFPPAARRCAPRLARMLERAADPGQRGRLPHKEAEALAAVEPADASPRLALDILGLLGLLVRRRSRTIQRKVEALCDLVPIELWDQPSSVWSVRQVRDIWHLPKRLAKSEGGGERPAPAPQVSKMPHKDPAYELAMLFCQIYTPNDIQLLIAQLPRGRDVLNSVPSGPVAPAHYAFEVVNALENRAMVNRQFFELVAGQRPERYPLIAEVWRLWPGAGTPAPPTPVLLPAANPPPAGPEQADAPWWRPTADADRIVLELELTRDKERAGGPIVKGEVFNCTLRSEQLGLTVATRFTAPWPGTGADSVDSIRRMLSLRNEMQAGPAHGFDAQVRTWGLELFRALEVGPAIATHLVQADGARVDITIRSLDRDTLTIPWELMVIHDQPVVLWPRVTLSRRYSNYGPPRSRPDKHPAGSLMFAWADPQRKVPNEAHRKTLNEVCGQAGIEVVEVSNASIDGMSEAAERAAAAGNPVRMIHLLAHGADRGQSQIHHGIALHASPSDRTLATVDGTQLRSLLERGLRSARLLVLAACDSGNAGSLFNPLGSLALDAHNAGVTTFASQFPLGVEASKTIVQELYPALLLQRRSLSDVHERVVTRLHWRHGATSYDWLSWVLTVAS